MKLKLLAVFFTLSICTTNLFAQANYLSVNTVTGTASATIPIYTVKYAGLSAPIYLSYNASGVKPKDVENTAGMGWQLVAGGQISRQIRGLPDDIKADNGGNTLLGWMYNTNQSTITSLTLQNDGTTCSKETTDISNINSYFGNLYDTEPDIFSVTAPGLSCSLVYDQSTGKFRTLPYQDLVITYATNSNGLITSFTITNDKGIKYLFSGQEHVTQTTNLTHNTSGVVNYFKNTYSRYKNGVNYFDSWTLSAMTNPELQAIYFNYTTAPARSSTNPITVYLAGSTTPSVQYNILQTVSPLVLSTISIPSDVVTPTTALTFNWTTNSGSSGTGQTMISSITGMGKNLVFIYSGVSYTRSDASVYNRQFLRNFSDNGVSGFGSCGSPVKYLFGYYGENSDGSGNYTTALPDSLSTQFDYWGYYNGFSATQPAVYVNPSTSGYTRYAICSASAAGSAYAYTVGTSHMTAATYNVMTGALNLISNAIGGSTSLTYESNDYLDVPSNAINYGGGIRVKQIVDYDGMNTANNIIRNYSYRDPVTGITTGKPISLPAYAFTIPYSGSATGQSLWTNATAISNTDLSSEDHTIMYSSVTLSMTNAGSTVYKYYLPATNWDSSASPACSGCSVDWAPTINYIGRTSCASNFGPVKNDTYSYPFIPNINYDFERGLLQQVIHKNAAGNEVAESNYTYLRSYSPTPIYAFQFDYNGGTSGVMAYNKYAIYANTSELSYQEIDKVFDSPTLSHANIDSVTYVYASTNHKQVTQQTTTNSDNSVLISNIKYSKDYTAVAGTNPNVSAIYGLQQENINAPVETWSQVKRGGVTYTTGASITLFKPDTTVGYVDYVPRQKFNFAAPDGDSNFAASNISGQTFTKYSGYQTVPIANYTAYDYCGNLVTADDGHHHQSTVMTDATTGKPILSATNANYNEIAFNDFDSQLIAPCNYVNLSGTPVGVAGHTNNGVTLSTSQTLSVSVTKNANANNYIYSIWINSGSNTGNLTLTLTPITGSPVTYVKAFPATGSSYKYLEWKIPVSAMTSSFTIGASTSASINIDDMLFYPENTEVTTYSYNDTTYLKSSMTNTNGVSTYYRYDQWGRLIYTYDRNKNILQKNTYITPSDIQSFGTGAITLTPSTGITTNTDVTLSTTTPGSCVAANTTYTWNFGDTSPSITTATNTSPSHHYWSIGTHTATLTIHSSLFGNMTTNQSVTTTAGTSVNLGYINNSSGGIRTIRMTNVDTQQLYVFAPGALAAGTATVPMGDYTIVLGTTGSFGSISLNGTTVNACQNYSSGVTTYTFNVAMDVCYYMNIVLNSTTCP